MKSTRYDSSSGLFAHPGTDASRVSFAGAVGAGWDAAAGFFEDHLSEKVSGQRLIIQVSEEVADQAQQGCFWRAVGGSRAGSRRAASQSRGGADGFGFLKAFDLGIHSGDPATEFGAAVPELGV